MTKSKAGQTVNISIYMILTQYNLLSESKIKQLVDLMKKKDVSY